MRSVMRFSTRFHFDSGSPVGSMAEKARTPCALNARSRGLASTLWQGHCPDFLISSMGLFCVNRTDDTGTLTIDPRGDFTWVSPFSIVVPSGSTTVMPKALGSAPALRGSIVPSLIDLTSS